MDMTRTDIIEKSASYSNALRKWTGLALAIWVSAIVTWAAVGAKDGAISVACFFALGLPLFICLVPLDRLQRRLKLECPHCHLRLFKPKVQQFVLESGICPKCKERIIHESF